jgi:tetrahydromethanopterin S-methyltransferase subunit C
MTQTNCNCSFVFFLKHTALQFNIWIKEPFHSTYRYADQYNYTIANELLIMVLQTLCILCRAKLPCNLWEAYTCWVALRKGKICWIAWGLFMDLFNHLSNHRKIMLSIKCSWWCIMFMNAWNNARNFFPSCKWTAQFEKAVSFILNLPGGCWECAT